MTDPFVIDSPCDADWEAMEPVGPGVRRCARCDEVVHDLATVPEGRAGQLAADRSACVRVTRTIDDRIVTLGGVVLAATLALAPQPAVAGPSPVVNPTPTPAQLERGRAQARKNVVRLQGTIVPRIEETPPPGLVDLPDGRHLMGRIGP